MLWQLIPPGSLFELVSQEPSNIPAGLLGSSCCGLAYCRSYARIPSTNFYLIEAWVGVSSGPPQFYHAVFAFMGVAGNAFTVRCAISIACKQHYL